MEKIILASASPRRRELFDMLGLSYKVAVSGGPEEYIAGEKPEETVMRLAEQKARAVAGGCGGSVVVAADTVVVVDGQILGKPGDADDAKRMLRLLSGRRHEVLSGLCVLRGDRCVTVFERTAVDFRELDEDTIEGYVATGEPFDKAGAYGIQTLGSLLVRGVEGDYFNVVGLPVSRLGRILREEFSVDIIKEYKGR